MFSRIPRSANNLRSKAKSEGNDQSILKGLAVFEGEYTYCFLRVDNSIWIDLTAFSASILSNSFISFRLQIIIRKTFSNYNFFCFQRRTIFSSKKILFFFGSDKFEFYLRILDNNFAKLKDRQIPNVVIRLIVVNAFRTMV